MNINPKIVLTASLALLIGALVMHVSIFLGLEEAPYSIDWFMTAAMVVIWLLSSRLFKQLHQNQPALPPVKVLRSNTPGWLPFFVAFVGLYAVFNMGMMIRTRWAGNNLRGISGFWIFFFAFGLLISWAKINQQHKVQNAHSKIEDKQQ